MKISILGLGWFGEPLAESLLQEGHEVWGSTRNEIKKKDLLQKNIQAEILDPPTAPSKSLLNADVVILNVPPFETELQWFKSWKWKKDTWLIFVSSISVETKPDSENGKILIEQEAWVKENFSRWTILRFGGLYGKDRHPGKHLSGRKNLPDGDRPIALVSLDEVIAFTKDVLSQRIAGQVLTVIGKDRRTRKEFYTEYCRENGLPLPEFE